MIQNVRFQRVPVHTSVLQLLFLNSSVSGRDSDIIVFAILQQSLDFDRRSNCVRIIVLCPLCGLIDRIEASPLAAASTSTRKAKAFLWSLSAQLLHGECHEYHSFCFGLYHTLRPAQMRSIYEARLRTCPRGGF